MTDLPPGESIEIRGAKGAIKVEADQEGRLRFWGSQVVGCLAESNLEHAVSVAIDVLDRSTVERAILSHVEYESDCRVVALKEEGR